MEYFYQAVCLARLAPPWGLRFVVLIPLGRPGLPKALLFVRREEVERGVQVWDRAHARAENLLD
jgi:hypothetical protein